jgi:hypothetical protein
MPFLWTFGAYLPAFSSLVGGKVDVDPLWCWHDVLTTTTGFGGLVTESWESYSFLTGESRGGCGYLRTSRV